MAGVLREQIRSGHFKPGERLPAERRLAQELSVDRRAVRRAINQLVGGGLVVRRPHCRPVVGPAPGGPTTPPADRPASAPASHLIALLVWNGGGRREGAITPHQRIFWGMNQALADVGCHAVFVDLGEIDGEKDPAAREADQLRRVLQRGFGGVVLSPYASHSNRALVEEVRRAIPLVTIDQQIDTADTDFVGVDNRRAMYDVARHLAARGHRRIAYITKNQSTFAVQDRIQGYIDAMREDDLNETVLSIPTRAGGQAWTSVDAVFRLPAEERPTAAAVFNDHAAAALAERLRGLGLSVPGDVAVTGFDDTVPALPGGVGLTTAAPPYEEIGRGAAEVLLRRLKTPCAPAASISLPARLTIRESSGDQGHTSAVAPPSYPIVSVPHTDSEAAGTKIFRFGTK